MDLHLLDDLIQRQMTKGIEAEADFTSKFDAWWLMECVTSNVQQPSHTGNAELGS